MARDEWPDDKDGPWTADEDTRRRVDELLSLLADQRRRDLLYRIAATDVTDVETLAAQLAAVHEEVSLDEVSSETQNQVQVDLVHTHLPKLAAAGAIEYDPRSGVIRCRALPPKLRHLVDTCHAIEVVE